VLVPSAIELEFGSLIARGCAGPRAAIGAIRRWDLISEKRRVAKVMTPRPSTEMPSRARPGTPFPSAKKLFRNIENAC